MNHLDLANYAKRAYNCCNMRPGLDIECQVDIIAGGGVVAIRGSELDFIDWGRNIASAFPWRSRAIGLAPFGFLRGAQRIVAAVLKGRVLARASSVYVTGHSAGAAMAILVSELLWKRDFPVRECVAFAAARTGGRQLQVKTTIYDHGGDPVLLFPPFWKHPVEPVVLPDMSPGIRQHPMDWYVEALQLAGMA